MAALSLALVNIPTANCVVPLILSSLWNAIKLGTQMGYDLTPEKPFEARVFLTLYNLFFLIAIWYKVRKSRKEKLELEVSFQ